MFTWITDKLFLGSLAAIAIIGAMFYLYFHISQQQIAALNQEIAQQSTAIELQKTTIDTLQKISSEQKIAIESLQNQMSASEAAHARLVAQIHNLNIVKNAQSNRVELQQHLNTQLQSLFTDSKTGGQNNGQK